jgi:queuine/archaeosine tRNA-ribosyltransferase
VVAMAHEVPCGAKSKHQKHSVTYTAKWLEEIKTSAQIDWTSPDIMLFQVLLVHNPLNLASIEQQAQAMMTAGAAALAIGCVNLPGGIDVDGGIGVLSAVRRAVGPACPIFFPRANTLHLLVSAITAGASHISSNIPSELTQQAVAALWSFGDKGDKARACIPKSTPVPSVADTSPDPVMESWLAERSSASASHLYLNLNDPVLREDPRPLSAHCGCHACANHSRAYLHHLLVANELLGQVLLHTHNQYQLVEMFNEARKAAADGVAALVAWGEQYTT